MAFFNGGSRALVEILTRFQSAERPMPVDHTFFEFGSVRYHVQASASDPDNVYLSISTPSLSHEAAPSTGLPEFTLQEARRMYRKFAEMVEPAREGYALTLRLNFSGLARPKDRARAVRQVSLLQSVVLGSQLKHLLGSLGPPSSCTTTATPSSSAGRRGRSAPFSPCGSWTTRTSPWPPPSSRSCRTPGARTRGRRGAAGQPSRRRSCAGSPCTTSPPTAASSPSTSWSGT